MINAIIRPPTESDIVELAQNMRAIDALECKLVGGLEPEAAIREGIEKSDWSYVGEANGKVRCIFGVTPQEGAFLEHVGTPWMLGTKSLERCARALLLVSRPQVNRMRSEYERLANIVHADNSSAIRWLRWLGFSFTGATKVQGEPFLIFEMEGAR